MSRSKKTNFEQMAEKSRSLFLAHDSKSLAGKYGTAFDEEYLYVDFLCKSYRIERSSGNVYVSADRTWKPAGPGETMIFYDVFCFGDPEAKASGEFLNHGSLVNQISATANPGKDMYFNYVRRFSGHAKELKEACGRMRGVSLDKGDAFFEIPLFSFMKCRFQFWEADEEFPPQIVIYTDTNILKFMHFETTWYASGCLLDRIAFEAGI